MRLFVRSFLNPRLGVFLFLANGGLGGTVCLAVNWRLCDSIRGGDGSVLIAVLERK